VEFHDRLSHDKLLEEMGRASVYAQVSRFEGHPKTIIEALAMGAPTVVTRAPGVDDEVRPGVTGLVCGDDPADIAAAILSLLRDRPFAERLSEAATADVRRRLALDAVFPLLEAACRDAMRSAGEHSATPAIVRWDQMLLNTGPDGAAAAFGASIAA